MVRSRFSAVALAYLVLVLTLGGASAAGFAANALLQILGGMLIGYCLICRDPAPTGSWPPRLRGAVWCLLLLIVVQLLPLPPSLWGLLPGREPIAAGYRLLGVAPPWLPVSLSAWATFASLAWWLPAIALLVAMLRSERPSAAAVATCVAAVAMVSIALGAIQRAGGGMYPYAITNYGLGTGFFANANHQASFLLCALALLAGSTVTNRPAGGGAGRMQASRVAYGAVAAVLVIGVLLSNSLAGISLLVPVLAGVAMVTRSAIPLNRRIVGFIAIVGLALAAGFFLIDPQNPLATGESGRTRWDYIRIGAPMAITFAPFGSGLGTFEKVYHWFEPPGGIGTSYVNHAHNDLLELSVETGVVGLAALVFFLAWWFSAAGAAWRASKPNAMTRAAVVLTGAVLLHSLVDYPLRTAAISSLFAIGCAFLLRPEQAVRDRARPHENARHSASVTI